MVKSLLARHSGEWDEGYLTEELKVPVAWIAEAHVSIMDIDQLSASTDPRVFDPSA